MYHPVSITHLSSAQVSKLLNGHPVRVKHGPGHHIEVSHEQHKKLQKAHSKVLHQLFNLILFNKQTTNIYEERVSNRHSKKQVVLLNLIQC